MDVLDKNYENFKLFTIVLVISVVMFIVTYLINKAPNDYLSLKEDALFCIFRVSLLIALISGITFVAIWR